MPGPALSILGSPPSIHPHQSLRECSLARPSISPPQQSHRRRTSQPSRISPSVATQHLVSVNCAPRPTVVASFALLHIPRFPRTMEALVVSTVVAASAASTPARTQVRLPLLRHASAVAGSLLAAPAALAVVNYDDFVNRASESASSLPSLPEFPSVDFVAADPLALVAGLVAVAVPFVASRAFASPATFGSVSAVEAFERLSDPNAQLLDIRAAKDIKAEGSPNLKSIKKKPVKVAYEDDANFVDKVFAKFKDAENTTLYILDRFDGSAASVAKLLANSGFKGAFAIKGGAEGPNGWQEKELPWAMPTKSFALNIDSLKSIIGDGQADAGNLVPTTVGVVAAAGVGLVVLSEAETTLQLLGTVAVAQLFLKKFLFAEDRKKTIEQIKTFLDTKIAPKEFVEEIKEVGRVLLPKEGEVKAAVATGASVLEEELGVDYVTPEAIAEKAKEEVEKAGVEIPEAITEKSTNGSSNGSAAPPAVEEEEEKTPSILPVLQEPPSLPPKAGVAEETPVAAEPVPETTAVEEATPFFESDKDLKPASPFQPVAEAVTADSSS